MSRTTSTAVESVWVRCKCGRAYSVILTTPDGATTELRGAQMYAWLNEWSRLWSRQTSVRRSRQTSLPFESGSGVLAGPQQLQKVAVPKTKTV